MIGNGLRTRLAPRFSVNSVCATAIGAGMLMAASSAHAIDIQLGEASVSVDTTVTLGVSVRTSDRDCTLVGIVNGGCPSDAGSVQSSNSDNGNLNFDQWDFFSANAKAVHDIEGNWENYGAFVRVKYFYDHIYAQNDLEFRNLEAAGRRRLNNDFRVLDAFVSGNFNVGGNFLSVRLGQQVLNWGESLFIQGGVNAFQAVDVTALRTPGAELKEALTPMPMLNMSFATPGGLSLEAFWQFVYEETKLDPAGSFFSVDDIVGNGALPALLNNAVDNPDLFAGPTAFPPNPLVPIALTRADDRGQEDINQFGFAVRYFADEVNEGTEFGLYFTRHSSRLPFLGFQNGDLTFNETCVALMLGPGCSGNPTFVQLAFAFGANQGNYFYDFPEAIDTFGASFNTVFGDTAVAGELTYTPEMPLALQQLEQNASQIDGLGATLFLTGGATAGPISRLAPVGPGGRTQSFVEEQVLQGQFSTIDTFGSSDLIPDFIGATGGTLLTNFGAMYAPDAGDFPLNRGGGERGIQNPFAARILVPQFGVSGNPGVTSVQYATSFSWGYRASFTADYNNFLGTSFKVSPNIAWRHDVTGFSPGPIGPGFVQGAKTISLGVVATYQDDWRGEVRYTNSFGGSFRNALKDRDFLSANVSYSF